MNRGVSYTKQNEITQATEDRGLCMLKTKKREKGKATLTQVDWKFVFSGKIRSPPLGSVLILKVCV